MWYGMAFVSLSIIKWFFLLADSFMLTEMLREKDLSKDAVFYLLLQSKSYTVAVCDLKSI